MAERSRSDIKATISAYIVANGAWGITPDQLHDILHDLADSYVQADDEEKEIVAYSVDVDDEGCYSVNGDKVLGAPGSNIVDAETEYSLNSTFDHSEVEGALSAIASKLNEILALAAGHGFMAGSA